MAQLFVVWLSPESTQMPEADKEVVQRQTAVVLRKRLANPLVYSATDSLCLELAAGVQPGAPVWVCPHLEGFQGTLDSLQCPQAQFHEEPRSFYGFANWLAEEGRSAVYFLTDTLKSQIDAKDLLVKKTFHSSVHLSEFVFHHVLNRLVERDPQVQEVLQSKLSLAVSLRESFATFTGPREHPSLANTVEQTSQALLDGVRDLTKPKPQLQFDSLKTLLKKATGLCNSANEKLQDVCRQAECYFQSDWDGRAYLQILEFSVGNKGWTLTIKNPTPFTFADVLVFVWETQTVVSQLRVVEKKSTVTTLVHLAHTPQLYTQHLVAQCQGLQASPMFLIAPVKIAKCRYNSGLSVELEIANLTHRPQEGLQVTSPEFVKALPVQQRLEAEATCRHVFQLPEQVRAMETLQLLIVKDRRVVSNLYTWRVPVLTPASYNQPRPQQIPSAAPPEPIQKSLGSLPIIGVPRNSQTGKSQQPGFPVVPPLMAGPNPPLIQGLPNIQSSRKNLHELSSQVSQPSSNYGLPSLESPVSGSDSPMMVWPNPR